MKLIYAIIRDAVTEAVSSALTSAGYTFTSLNSTGGFLKRGNVTLLIGVKAEQVDTVIKLIKAECPISDQEEHAATVFVLNLPGYLKV